VLKLYANPLPLLPQLEQIIGALPQFMPELFLAVGFIVMLLAEVLLKISRWSAKQDTILAVLTLCFLFISLLFALNQWTTKPQFLFEHLLFLDAKAVYFKILVTIGAICTVVHVQIKKTDLPPEFYSILLAVLLGLYLMTMAVNGLSIYLSIELVSIGGYLFVAFGTAKKSAEGGMKYLLFGAISSAVMLYGFSWLYGLTGTLDFTDPAFAQNLSQNSPKIIFVVGFLSLSGIFFKLSLVPFHPYTPDVYEAAPTPIVAFLSVAPKAAALLVLMRIINLLPIDFQLLFAIVALISILVGNLAALAQNDYKRLLAYSGIAQAGFVLVGLVAANQSGVESAVFYITVYVFMNLSAFLLLDLLADGQDIRDLAGVGHSQPFFAILLTIVLVSLVGLPLTAGFMAKLLVFSALWQTNQSNNYLLTTLFVVGLLNVAVSLFYYFKIPFYLFFRESKTEKTQSKPNFLTIIWTIVLVLPIIILFFRADWLITLIELF
jgi:NADH-quinone oxidoreductase subunit N